MSLTISRFKTARTAATFLSWVLDLIALVALAESGEVHLAVFAAAACSFAICRIFRPRISQGWLLSGLAMVILSTAGIWATTKLHPVVAAAHGAPLAHALIWLEGGGSGGMLGWRIGMGFIELIVASALTPDAFLPVLIILFVVVASVAISCGFLDGELKREAPEFRENPLPPGFVRRSLGFALLTFLSSAIIFPILPRVRGAGFNFQLGSASTGYTERVNVSQWHSVNDDNSSQVMLRIYPVGGLDLSTDIYLGLLRGRVLERFDGRDWKPAIRRALGQDEFRQQASLKYSRPATAIVKMDVVREPLSSEILPIPYGALDVLVRHEEEKTPARPLHSGEWTDLRSMDSRAQYTVALTPNDLSYLKERQSLDPPTDTHRFVPESLRSERMLRLARQAFGGAVTDSGRIQNLMAFFRKNGYSAPDPSQAEEPVRRTLASSRLTPLEEFLFVTKEGHCEWFSSAAGVLLRLGGIPSRLVAGFRLTKGPSGGVLTVRSRDAHAWVEAWTKERGWVPIDVTPRILRGNSIFEGMRDSYDLVAAYWFKYVVSYGDQSDLMNYAKSLFTAANWETLSLKLAERWSSLQEWARKNSGIVLIGAVLLALTGLAATIAVWTFFPWMFSIRFRVQEGPFKLRRERIRMERLRRRKGVSLEKDPRFQKWQNQYHQVRFGPGRDASTLTQEVRELRTLYEEVRKKTAA